MYIYIPINSAFMPYYVLRFLTMHPGTLGKAKYTQELMEVLALPHRHQLHAVDDKK
jgi:hypothetical protein